MHSRAGALTSCVVLLVIAAVSLTATPAGAAMGRPTWAAGDFWVYAFSSASPDITVNGTLRMEVTGTESVTVNGTSYSAYRVAATLLIPFGSLSLTLPADIWFSTDSLAIVRIRAVVSLTIGNVPGGSTIVVAGNPPQTIHWPLTAGDTWSSTTTVGVSTTSSDGSTNYVSTSLTTIFLVQPDVSVTVPAGTFMTTPVKETEGTAGSYSVNYWSASVGNWARVGTYDSSGQEQGGFNLTSYRCQGCNFLTMIVLGLPLFIWLGLLVLVLAVVVVIFVARRRRPPSLPMPPTPPVMPPENPPGSGP